MRLATGLALVLLMMMLSACVSESSIRVDLTQSATADDFARLNPEGNGTLSVGFDRHLEPKEDVKMYVPLLNYLERALRKITTSDRKARIIHTFSDGFPRDLPTVNHLRPDQQSLIRAMTADVAWAYSECANALS